MKMDMFVVHRKKRSMVFFLSSLYMLDDDLCFQCVGISYVYCFIDDRRRPLILSFITLSLLFLFPLLFTGNFFFFCAPLFFSLICPHDVIFFFFSSIVFFFYCCWLFGSSALCWE